MVSPISSSSGGTNTAPVTPFFDTPINLNGLLQSDSGISDVLNDEETGPQQGDIRNAINQIAHDLIAFSTDINSVNPKKIVGEFLAFQNYGADVFIAVGT